MLNELLQVVDCKEEFESKLQNFLQDRKMQAPPPALKKEWELLEDDFWNKDDRDKLLCFPLRFKNSIGSFLTELAGDDDLPQYDSAYIKNLIRYALCFDCKTSCFPLFELLVSEQMLPFWTEEKELCEEVRIFLEDYFNEECGKITVDIQSHLEKIKTAYDRILSEAARTAPNKTQGSFNF